MQDHYLLLRILCIVAPTLLLLTVQTVLYPITLHSHIHINEVTITDDSKNVVIASVQHLQDYHAVDKIYYVCEGKYYLIFDAVLFTGDIALGLLSAVLAFQTKKHLPADKKYRKYHESAVINLTTMMATFLSSICEAVVILFQLNNIQNGILLIITLRECLWLYPVSFLLFIPKVSR